MAGDTTLIPLLHAWSRPRGSVIAREELLRRDITSARIGRLVERAVLFPKHHGVDAVGRPDVSPYGEAWAAYLATRGRRAEPRRRGLTGRSAGALLGVGPVPATPEVLVLARAGPTAVTRSPSTRTE